jgi:hypothetical protein
MPRSICNATIIIIALIGISAPILIALLGSALLWWGQSRQSGSTCDEAHIGAIEVSLNAGSEAANKAVPDARGTVMSKWELIAIAIATVLGLALIAAMTVVAIGA